MHQVGKKDYNSCLVLNFKNCQPLIQKYVIFWCSDRRCFYSHLELLYVASLLHQCFKCRNTYYYKMGFYKAFLPLHLKGNFISCTSKTLSVLFFFRKYSENTCLFFLTLCKLLLCKSLRYANVDH